MARLAVSLAGAFVGNLIAPGIGGQIGFALGSAAGSLLFADDLPTLHGPKLDDGKITSSAYGAMVPLLWGTIDSSGNVLDAGELITEQSSSSVGGKGGPSQDQITYTQYLDLDVAIAERCEGIVQIFANETLIYDASPGAMVKQPAWLDFIFYDGADTQQPDPTFEALRGAGNVPNYRGISHVVFRRFNVTEFGTTAISFRFVVTTNGAASISSVQYDQGGSGLTPSIVHNLHTDLMIGSVYREITGGGTEQMLVAFDPYSQTEAWTAFISDAATYASAYWVMQCGFPDTDDAGMPLYPPNSVIAVYHHQNVSFPQNRFMRFFSAESGLQLGLVAISTSESNPKIVSAFADDAVFYQLRYLGTPASVSMKRHVIPSSFGISSATIPPPDGYSWFGANTDALWVKPGSRLAGSKPMLLAVVVNDTTSAVGFVTWQDETLGLGATTWAPAFSSVDELPGAAGNPRSGVYDKGEDCFWVLSTDSGKTVVSRVELDGSITSTTDWGTTFSIAGAANAITIDDNRDLLWLVIGGVAYAWPTYDSTATPVGYGTGIKDAPLAWHPYSGSLWAGWTKTLTDSYWQYRLQNLSGGGVSLQQVVEDILDYPGTNILPADHDCSALAPITVNGFRIANITQRRAAIDILRATYQFDLVTRSGVLTAVVRGGASSATLGDDLLGAHLKSPGDAPPRLEIMREAEDRLPRLVGVSFIDASQNYERGYETASRQASFGGTERRLELAVVLTHDEGAQLASVLVHSMHVEAERYRASCMPSQRAVVVPAAVVTAEVDGVAYPMRVDTANIIDGGIVECAGVRHDASVYADLTIGGTTRDRSRSVASVGTTQLIPLDIPALREQDLPAGYYVGGATYSPAWDGATVLDSEDGVSYAHIATLDTELTYGFLTAALPDGPETDLDNTLSVRLVSGALSSISDTAWQSSATENYAAIGAPGRWEIIQFRSSSESAGVYTLSGLLRGVRDTIGSKGTGAVGDKFILLDAAALRRVAVPATYLSTLRWLKASSFGRSVDDAVAIAFTPNGRSLRPFRPVNLQAQLSGSDWLIGFDRQDRRQAGFLQQPVLSEASESYLVEILDFAGNMIRQTTVGSPSFSYTAAMQTADFGGVISLLWFRAAQVSAVVGAGPYAYARTGRYSADYDALVTSRPALIDFWPFDEPSGTTAGSNSATHDGVYTNGPTLNSTSLTEDGSPSVRLNTSGNDDRIQFTPGAWSAAIRGVDFVIRPNAFSAISQSQGLVWASTGLGGGVGWAVMLRQDGRLEFRADPSNVYTDPDTQVVCATPLSLDQSYHVQVNFGALINDDVEIRVDGLLAGAGTMASSVTYPSTGYFWVSGMLQHLQSNIAKLGVYSSNLTAYDAALATLTAKGLT